MTEFFGDIKNYLPQYLSAPTQEKLFAEVKKFPDNIDERLYSQSLLRETAFFQGDGLHSLWVANLPDTHIGKARVLLLSNSCDMSDENKRLTPRNIFYCLIVSLAKYREMLANNAKSFSESQLREFIETVRKQQVTQVFFLPQNAQLGEDCIALLDRISNCDSRACNVPELVKNRLFVLSNYGFYMFLIKLSIHFTRLREGLNRDAIVSGNN